MNERFDISDNGSNHQKKDGSAREMVWGCCEILAGEEMIMTAA